MTTFSTKQLVTAVSVGAFLLWAVVSFTTNYNYGNRAENQLEATWTDNQNVLSAYTLKIHDMVQVTDMMRDDLNEVIGGALAGRYGENGSQAIFQMLTEDNPTVDPGLYNRLQQVMEAGRNEFRVSQTRLIDQRRSYETNLGYLVKGFWLERAGYPKIDLAQFDPITSVQAQETFDSGIDTGLTLRPDTDE